MIAVVDDDPGYTGYLQTFLTVRGYDARPYARGDEILAAVRHGECPDAVVLDVAMPGMDGLQTLKALRSACPGLEVIMLSGLERANVIVDAVQLGAADFIVKGDEADGSGNAALDAAITHAIERHRQPIGVADLHWSRGPAMRQVAEIIEQVSDSDVTVLIRGESGVGKELVARAMHERSSRRQKPFVKVNCAALPAELIESELFGHEKGAFTGATGARIGKFEQAHLGTILLDEIGEMTPALQAKLLQVLQDGEFTRLGSNQTVTTDVRVLAATNQNLEEMIRRGEFREDLYYRLKVIEAVVPPLRERRDEIPPLADFFIAKYAGRYQRPVPALSPQIWRLFQEYDWPGNIRELENTIKRFVILQDECLVAQELSGGGPAEAPVPAAHEDEPDPPAAPAIPEWENGRRLADVVREASLAAERAAILSTLQLVRWNRRKAAQDLGVSYKTLLNKIKATGITRP